MSNARNLANLLGTNTTVPRAKQPSGSVLQCVTTNYPDDFIFSLSNLDKTISIFSWIDLPFF